MITTLQRRANSGFHADQRIAEDSLLLIGWEQGFGSRDLGAGIWDHGPPLGQGLVGHDKERSQNGHVLWQNIRPELDMYVENMSWILQCKAPWLAWNGRKRIPGKVIGLLRFGTCQCYLSWMGTFVELRFGDRASGIEVVFIGETLSESDRRNDRPLLAIGDGKYHKKYGKLERWQTGTFNTASRLYKLEVVLTSSKKRWVDDV
ncbi:hypothetical protein F5148DRAFT_1370933 [Russula earlei]|uniref:Uncharacterized protein n=1 Tax=Russula earlei TaxID=71964 RepID=A0ACC0TUS2_9AGAM|nr:hypothetical protein F5148DRAFT_1370933 [Russula earlei]